MRGFLQAREAATACWHPPGHGIVIGCLLVLSLVSACQTPTARLHQRASDNGFERRFETADGFRHTVYESLPGTAASRSEPAPIDVLHIYLEGDGSPWRYRTLVMADPTPRHPLMLDLMAIDDGPSVYIGRPCYNGSAQDPGCDNRLWTSARYSSTVVDSMAAVVRRTRERLGARELWLFGHSGGGTLAMLLAEQLPSVTRVITLAGNLDIEAWTRHHRYTPLHMSLNPAARPSLRPDVWQWHLLGRRDQVTPADLSRPFVMRQRNASGVLLDDFDHGCCWRRLWPDLLGALAAGRPDDLPGRVFKQADGAPASSAGNP